MTSLTTSKGHEAFVLNGDLTHAVRTLNILTFFRDFIMPQMEEGQSASTTFYDVNDLLHNYVTTDAYIASLLRSFGGVPAVRFMLEQMVHGDDALFGSYRNLALSPDDVRCYIDQTREKITTLISQ